MFNVNISIDDVSPHPLSSTKVLKRCHELIEEFKEIKFTLFVPISYWRTIPPDYDRADTRTESPLQIDLHPEFCEELRNLPEENFEIAYHGYFHGIPQQSNNDEFKSMGYSDALERFKLMFNTVAQADLKGKFKPIFRPPAWRMSPAAIQAAKDAGIEILALSPKPAYREVYAGAEVDPLTLCSETEIVYHACEWDRNYLDECNTNELKAFLKQNENKINFCFIGDIDGDV